MKILLVDCLIWSAALALFAMLQSYLLASRDGIWLQALSLLVCLLLVGGLQACTARR
jgi:hypothetical protein